MKSHSLLALKNLPKRKNCRVDYFKGCSYLIEFGSVDHVIYFEGGIKQLEEVYGNFKFKANNCMSIDNYPLSFMPYEFKKIDGVKYDF